MTWQTLTLGDSVSHQIEGSFGNFFGFDPWELGPEISGIFLEDGNPAILAGFFLVYPSPGQQTGLLAQFFTYRIGQSRLSGGDPDPQMVPTWESSGRAITLSAGGVNLVLPGPTSPAALTTDSDEPYSWTLPEEDAAEYREWLEFYDTLDAETQAAATLTISDTDNKERLNHAESALQRAINSLEESQMLAVKGQIFCNRFFN